MPRPIKEGLDYFELDCHFDEKIRLIQAEFGLKGLAVIVLLFKEIYGGQGYYMTWDEDRLLLLMSENGVAGGDKNLINEIVSACIRRDIFSEKLFEEYRILTSSGIQRRYLNAVARRENVKLKKEYLLISVGNNKVNVDRNPVIVDRNSINVDRNPQSREEKSREENKDSIKDTIRSTEIERIVTEWNALSRYGIKSISKINDGTNRQKWLKARLQQYSIDDILKALANIRSSSFLQGNNKNGWVITFDWFIRPNNFPKVLEGNYNDEQGNRENRTRTDKYEEKADEFTKFIYGEIG